MPDKTPRMLMGNEAIGFGALRAGVNVVAGYPGTPSTEVLETIAKNNPGPVHVEWSTNEKAALEVAAGASYSGARSLVTMKQVGMNVASDPLMSLSYIGVKGGLVCLVADDPGPISSQTEQDTRLFGRFAKVPVLDPTTPEQAYEMMPYAFELSERYDTPVIVRPTTRICHARAAIALDFDYEPHAIAGFERSPRWVIFPRLSHQRHLQMNEEMPRLGDEFSNGSLNSVESRGAAPRRGIVCGGVSDAYVRDALSSPEFADASYRLATVATPYPFPEAFALSVLEGLDEVICFEELEPVIETELTYLCGKHHLPTNVRGKLTGDTAGAGENSAALVRGQLDAFLGVEAPEPPVLPADTPELPVRPPVLCAGCPHRGSFYAVKRALRGKKAFFTGDIGCYTLGNAMPLDMVDTCLCMGADVTIAQGMHVAEPDAKHVAFIGDSTFFASGITGVVNAHYNKHDITLVVLDNSTTAMTGHQPHPGTGVLMSGTAEECRPGPAAAAHALRIEDFLRAAGADPVITADPLDLEGAEAAVAEAVAAPHLSAVIFKSPCIWMAKPSAPYEVDESRCTNCKSCINQIGCPAITRRTDKDGSRQVVIDPALCYGCGLCSQVCHFGAIRKGGSR